MPLSSPCLMGASLGTAPSGRMDHASPRIFSSCCGTEGLPLSRISAHVAARQEFMVTAEVARDPDRSPGRWPLCRQPGNGRFPRRAGDPPGAFQTLGPFSDPGRRESIEALCQGQWASKPQPVVKVRSAGPFPPACPQPVPGFALRRDTAQGGEARNALTKPIWPGSGMP